MYFLPFLLDMYVINRGLCNCTFCLQIKLNKVLSDDKDVKDRILGKYGFVDQDEDKRYHRPNLKKNVSTTQCHYLSKPRVAVI